MATLYSVAPAVYVDGVPQLLSGSARFVGVAVKWCQAVCVSALTLAAGCYSAPDYSSAHLKCDADHGCPPDQACVNGFCDPDGVPSVSVECGGVVCGADQACCVDVDGNVTCIAAGVSCEGVSATCDGAEDCNGGACCLASLGADASCGDNTCDNQLCREDEDCRMAGASICCFGLGLPGEPWGRCGPTCP